MTVKVILEEDTETLDEVVVVGYGVQKKSDVTGAMAVSYTHLSEQCTFVELCVSRRL